jgi:tetratricopeptide (TPR) repeat protein
MMAGNGSSPVDHWSEPMMDGTDLAALCQQRSWTRPRLMLELRTVARVKQRRILPDDASLKRMIREWIHGRRGLSPEYAELFAEIFGSPFMTGKPGTIMPSPGGEGGLAARLSAAANVDSALIDLFAAQTQSFRALDRQLGAARLLEQTESHLGQMNELYTYVMPGAHRSALAAELAETAALAGWQALDLGDPGKAWTLHETGKTAARESGKAAVVAHVTAQQAYALLDLNRATDAIALIQHAHREAGSQIPGVLRSWLWAAEAEALAAAGLADAAKSALDKAAHVLPASGMDEALPFLFLDEAHLARWRGHCLARLGASEAVEALTDSVARLDPTFTRAAAGVRCDLALAYSVRGQHEEARAEARVAEELATRTASARQRRRIGRLLKSGTERSVR